MGGQIDDLIKNNCQKINDLRAIDRLIDSTDFRLFYQESSSGIKKQLKRLIEEGNIKVLKKWKTWHRRHKLETLTLYELRELGMFLGFTDKKREVLISKIRLTYGSEIKGACSRIIKRKERPRT